LFLFAPKITKGIQKIVDWSSKQKAWDSMLLL
jgi:hypothetical protein